MSELGDLRTKQLHVVGELLSSSRDPAGLKASDPPPFQDRQVGGAERRRPEQGLEWRRGDQQRREEELEGDAQSRRRLLGTPTENSDARSVRAANAVPIWATTIDRKVVVVAGW